MLAVITTSHNKVVCFFFMLAMGIAELAVYLEHLIDFASVAVNTVNVILPVCLLKRREQLYS